MVECSSKRFAGIEWLHLFSALVWHVWKSRNKGVIEEIDLEILLPAKQSTDVLRKYPIFLTIAKLF